MLARLPPEELEEISPDDGWFIFGVVRTRPRACGRRGSPSCCCASRGGPSGSEASRGSRASLRARSEIARGLRPLRGRDRETSRSTRSCATATSASQSPHARPPTGCRTRASTGTRRDPAPAGGLRAGTCERRAGRGRCTLTKSNETPLRPLAVALHGPGAWRASAACTREDFERFGYEATCARPGWSDPALPGRRARRGDAPDRARRAHQRRDPAARARATAAATAAEAPPRRSRRGRRAARAGRRAASRAAAEPPRAYRVARADPSVVTCRGIRACVGRRTLPRHAPRPRP